MAIHVNIGEAKTRLSELLAAALRGEEVVLQKAGVPKAKLVPLAEADESEAAARVAKRMSNLGYLKDKYRGVDLTVPPSMTEEELEERYRRKFGPAD